MPDSYPNQDSLPPSLLWSISEEPCNYDSLQVPHLTSTMPGQTRTRQEIETLIEVQLTEMQNNTPEGQAIVGNNIPISASIDYVGALPTHMGAQSSLEPISTPALNSVSSIENAKQLVKALIELPLEALKDPENETSLKAALSILACDPSLVSKEQEGSKILELLLDAPILMHNWREICSILEEFSQKYSAEMKNFKDSMEKLVREEEILKVREEQVENKKKELEKQMEAVKKEKAEIAEQRMKQEAHRNKEEDLMGISTTNLKDLTDQWAKIQYSFVH